MKTLVTLICTLLATVLAHPTTSNRGPILPREMDANKPSGVHLVSYTVPDCGPNGFSNDFLNVQYSMNSPVEISSYWISRDLDPSEQLDFSTSPPGGEGTEDLDPHCGLFVEKAPPAIKQGCHTLGKGSSCFRLWHH